MAELVPLERLLVADLFPALGRRLVDLLRSLDADDWHRPTLCAGWTVRDLAAHLLDSACRRVSVERDGWLPEPDVEIDSYRGLVAYLDRLNAQWVTAARRVSPRLLTDTLAAIEPQLAEVLREKDPETLATFPVTWAGEEASRAWFDVARELTERWHHQQQIREAVGAPGLDDPRFVAPVLETFLRVLPHHYREVEAARGTTLAIRIVGETTYRYTLRSGAAEPVDSGSGSGRWRLYRGWPEEPTSAIGLDQRSAWLLLTKGADPEEIWGRAQRSGDRTLARPYFDAVAVMA